jgi:hypothetical protein
MCKYFITYKTQGGEIRTLVGQVESDKIADVWVKSLPNRATVLTIFISMV